MKRTIVVCFMLIPLLSTAQQQKYPPTPDKIYGQLFIDVQLHQVLPDGKTFVDCTPKRKVADIMYDYGMMKGPNLNLKKFVADNFNLPPAPPQLNYIQQEKDAAMHIKNLWGVLRRDADLSPRWEGKAANGISLLALPYPYIVPGGRFREVYYWDSYFTMLGLKASGEVNMIENMVNNFDYLIYNFGHVPNGNRTYYLSRSQPPFFCMMVELLAGIKGNSIYKKYLPSMLKEYAYWMEGAAEVKKGEAIKRVVKLQDGTVLNRYWDDSSTPRQESYKEDTETAEAAALELAMRIKVASPEKLKEILDKKRADTYREIRAGACSGWDFSSRWFSDPNKMATIQTTSMVPVDLNSLLYSMETSIAKACKLNGKTKLAIQYNQKAAKRKAAVSKYCWNKDSGFFFDYNFATTQQPDMITAAGVFPLFVKMASPQQAMAVANTVQASLLKEGGIVTTTNNTGQQWDAPNGWAPLQWATISGLKNYNNNKLANSIAQRWLALNDKVYAATGKMMEKYNVEDLSQLAGGGEYPSQDGFGWTNGVYLALKSMMPIH
ncbi:MAG: alpha,alpha-trehalase TreA [Chitinophagaceae bacterium]|nr:alpha,alpha-trehalase TreA [Chitinophagaceae bacterium]